MKQLTVQVFFALGVIFLIFMIISIYFIATNPYGVKPFLLGDTASTHNNGAPVVSAESDETAAGSIEGNVSSGFQLSSDQVGSLVSLGIDPGAVPTSISTEQEVCFVAALGSVRVEEIKAGDVPSIIEFMKVESCV